MKTYSGYSVTDCELSCGCEDCRIIPIYDQYGNKSAEESDIKEFKELVKEHIQRFKPDRIHLYGVHSEYEWIFNPTIADLDFMDKI